MFSFSFLSFFFQRRKKMQNTGFYCLIKLNPHFQWFCFLWILVLVFYMRWNTRKLGRLLKFSFIVLVWFGLVLVWKIILSVSAALLSLFSIFLHTPGWLWMALNCSLIRENKWWFHNFIDLSWDHGRDDSGFWKLYQPLKICFGKQVRNIIASLLTRMNITAVSSRCHKLYGYIRDLTREHLCS